MEANQTIQITKVNNGYIIVVTEIILGTTQNPQYVTEDKILCTKRQTLFKELKQLIPMKEQE